MSGALLASALTVSVGAPGVGAQSGEPATPAENVEFVETVAESPLSPGVAAQQHFTTLVPLPVASADGFFSLEVTDDQFEITEISIDGTVTTQTVTAESTVAGSVRPLQLTDDYLLAEAVMFEGPFIDEVDRLRLDLATGELDVEETFDRDSAIRMSPDGDIVTGGTLSPTWQSLSEPGTGGSFVEDGFVADEVVPTLSSNGRYVAVAGARTVDGDVSNELWVSDTTAPDGDRKIELPCSADSCAYEVDAIATRDTGASVLVTGYELDVDGITRTGASRHEVVVADGRVEAAVAVSVVSSNGRYVAGMAATDDSLTLSSSEVLIHDLVTGRERSFTSDLPEAYALELLGLSDDGRTLRYLATIPCPDGLACAVQPSYFGHIDLLPVADVTKGPAADQILRLYRAVFGRIPDEGGFDFWMSRYREGEPLFGTAGEFALSQEFADRFGENPTDEELIDALYRNTLGRAGDDGGVAFWLDRRANGMTIADLLIAFSDSPENIERTGTRQPVTVPEGRVLRVYRAVLGRDPDASGLAFWVGQYNNGLSLAEMAEQFTFQPEYEALYGEDPSDEDLVAAVYRNVLGRDGDPGGVDFWLDQLATGLTVPALFVSFADSPENIENTGTVR